MNNVFGGWVHLGDELTDVKCIARICWKHEWNYNHCGWDIVYYVWNLVQCWWTLVHCRWNMEDKYGLWRDRSTLIWFSLSIIFLHNSRSCVNMASLYCLYVLSFCYVSLLHLHYKRRNSTPIPRGKFWILTLYKENRMQLIAQFWNLCSLIEGRKMVISRMLDNYKVGEMFQRRS